MSGASAGSGFDRNLTAQASFNALLGVGIVVFGIAACTALVVETVGLGCFAVAAAVTVAFTPLFVATTAIAGKDPGQGIDDAWADPFNWVNSPFSSGP